MNDNRAIEILKCLSSKDIDQFELYLSSPYFHVEENVVKIFHYLKRLSPPYSSEQIDPKKIHHSLFPTRTYNNKNIRYLFSYLTKHLEHFIAHQALLNKPLLYADTLNSGFIEKQIEGQFLVSFKRSVKTFQSQTLPIDTNLLYHEFKTEANYLFHEFGKQKRNSNSNMSKTLDSLEVFYITQKLQLCCWVYNQKNVLEGEYQLFMFDELLQNLSKHPYLKVPLISVYYHIVLTLKESENEQHFISLTQLLDKYGETFVPSDLRNMYQYVLNYCIKKTNQGNANYLRTLFEVYQTVLPKNALLIDGTLSQWDYKNIVTVSLRLKEYAWAQEFIHDYKSLIPLKERENAFIYNIALWNYHNKNYSETLKLLQKVEFTDVFYQLDTKAILLKTYYEMDDDEALFYHATAFTLFIKRNKTVSTYQATIYKNLVKYVSRLVRYKTNTKKIEQITNEIEEVKQIADLAWLKQKISEL